ncbi:unnamed protein product [Paramecium sonneborni]|uniref:Uncharacterized protein n=1 Tax=Paramecium sonneborni TaxID=65129 RepID=A0A8S1RTY2_9CILI|nr:unnamed protein product [Paramecium sonneborni]
MNNQFLPDEDDPQTKEERKNFYHLKLIFYYTRFLEKKLLWERNFFNYTMLMKNQKSIIRNPNKKHKSSQMLKKLKHKKQCPQKTGIEYPKEEPKIKQQYFPIDFIQKRKPEAEIKKEIDKYYEGRKYFRPAIQGQDKKKLIEQLQRVFKYKRGALPKGAELPEIILTITMHF